jgi:hypothetical protein
MLTDMTSLETKSRLAGLRASRNAAISKREAERELQLLRFSDPLEAFERANAIGVDPSPNWRKWPYVSVSSFWVRAAMLLGLVILLLLRGLLHR